MRTFATETVTVRAAGEDEYQIEGDGESITVGDVEVAGVPQPFAFRLEPGNAVEFGADGVPGIEVRHDPVTDTAKLSFGPVDLEKE